MDSGGIEEKENQVYQVTPLSVPWFPQGTVPDGPGHLFVMFLVAFVQVTQNIRASKQQNSKKFSGCPCHLLVLGWDRGLLCS